MLLKVTFALHPKAFFFFVVNILLTTVYTYHNNTCFALKLFNQPGGYEELVTKACWKQWGVCLWSDVIKCFFRTKEVGWWYRGLLQTRGIKMVQLLSSLTCLSLSVCFVWIVLDSFPSSLYKIYVHLNDLHTLSVHTVYDTEQLSSLTAAKLQALCLR